MMVVMFVMKGVEKEAMEVMERGGGDWTRCLETRSFSCSGCWTTRI